MNRSTSALPPKMTLLSRLCKPLDSRRRPRGLLLALLPLLMSCGGLGPRAPVDVVPDGEEGVVAVVSPDTGASAGQRAMIEAMAGMRAGRAAEMSPLWRRALVEYPALRDYHLYYLGLAEASAGNVEEAQRQFTTLLRDEGKSVLAPYAEFRLGSLLAEGNPGEAITHLRVARAGLPKGSAEWAKASLLLARLEIEEGHAETAWQLLADLRRQVGPGVARRRARRETRRLAAARPDRASRAPQVAEEAELLLREDDPVEAERLLVATLEAKPPARFRPGLLSLLATAQHEDGRLEVAEETMGRLLTDYPSHPLAPPGLLAMARWRWNRDEDGLALRRFSSFIRQYPRDSEVPEAIYAVGRIHQDAGRLEASRKAYKDLARRFPRAESTGDAQWRLGWIDYTLERYAAAADSFGRLVAQSKQEWVRERALYWQARAVERHQGVAAAWPLFARVITEFSAGFYAVWAEEWLAEHALDLEAAGEAMGSESVTRGSRNEGVPARGRPLENPKRGPRSLIDLTSEPGASALTPERFRRAVDLTEMGLERHSRRELEAITFPPASRLDGRLVLLEAHARVGAYDRVLGLSRLTAPGSPRVLGEPMDRFRYPLAYWRLVRKYATAYRLDPYLITALIRQESAFDSDAVSPKGARGLMQLMPETAAAVAQRLGLPPPGRKALSDPELNIRLGTAYLGRLLGAYGGAVHRALAAYNGGKDAVAKWDRRFPNVPPDEFVEQISYRETQGYVKAVMRNYRIYRFLYGEIAPAPGWARIIHGVHVAKAPKVRQIGPRVASLRLSGTGLLDSMARSDKRTRPVWRCTWRLQQGTHEYSGLANLEESNVSHTRGSSPCRGSGGVTGAPPQVGA